MFKKVLLKTVLHVFLLKSKLLFLVSKNSELKAKFLFKNKATKSNKNVPSLGIDVVGVVLGGNVAVGVSLGGSPAVGVNSGVNVIVDGIVAVGGNVVVGVTLGGSILVRVSLGGSIDVGVSLCVSDVVGGSAAAGGNVAVGEVAMGGIVGISVEVTVGGIFSFSAMAVGGGNVTVSLGLGSTVVVNVIDVVCPFCFCCVLGGVVLSCLVSGTVGGIVGVSGKAAAGCVVTIGGEVVVGGIVGTSVEVTVGGVFSPGAMAAGGGNVTAGPGFGSTVVATFPCETFTIAS